MTAPISDKAGLQMLKASLAKGQSRLKTVRARLKRPLVFAEKILLSRLDRPEEFQDSAEFLMLRPDRVILQDATAQMAALQFMLAGRPSVAAPTSIHCDHLITAKEGAEADMEAAVAANKEVYDFLSSFARRYGCGFWKPGAGIIHQVALENYAFPGGLMIGADSHTPNAGGLGMLAVGVGGADAVDVMAGFAWELKRPQITGVRLTGSLSGWASPKDVILKLLSILTTKGGSNKIIEYFGEGCQSISSTGKATIANMGAELGATSSLFPYDSRMGDYLRATSRGGWADWIEGRSADCAADPETNENPEDFYDELIEIDLSRLKPLISGPHSPDRVRPLKDLKAELKEHGWPPKLSAALIGSCTNSSYEDMGRAAHVARQAARAGFTMPQPFLVTPGSEMIKKTIGEYGYIKSFQEAGAKVLANACGPCIGQWRRPVKKGETNTILNSFNRNFPGRNDASPNTLSFIASPEIVMAAGLAGRLDFDPETDELKRDGKTLKFQPPEAEDLPKKPFQDAKGGYIPPWGAARAAKEEIKISPQSERLQPLKPFPPLDLARDFQRLAVLCKARGKCTTDHISPAGFWLRYRGHLDKISDNLLMGAVNDFTGERGRGLNLFTKQTEGFAAVARDYKRRGQGWVIAGGENYGEGSSRELAAMSPRHLGARAVLAKSFARIHETNLKKQGVLPLAFDIPGDYEKFRETSRLTIKDLPKISPGSRHQILISYEDGSEESIFVRHSLNSEQIKWLKAGSSLNMLRQSQAENIPG